MKQVGGVVMLNKQKLFYLIISFSILLCIFNSSKAQNKFFHLSEKWSVQLANTVRAIHLHDINHNYSQEILIGAGSLQDCYPSCYGFVYIVSDSARDVIESSGDLEWGISCIEAGDLDQNGEPEILAGMSDGVYGGVSIFSDAHLDSHTLVPDDDFFPAVVSIKTVPMGESTVVYLASYLVTTGYPVQDYVGLVYVGSGYLSNLEMIYGGNLIEHIEFADLDLDQYYELIFTNFYWYSMGMPGDFPVSANIVLWTELTDSLARTDLFSFDDLWDLINGGGFTSLRISNCDSDSSLEVLGSAFVDTCFPVHLDTCCITVLSVVDGLTKTEQWRTTYFGDVNIVKGIASVDINQDGINEVLVAHQNAPMELLNGEDGSKIAESDSSFTVDQFAFGDVDGDREKEIVIGEGYVLRVFEVDFTTDVPEKEKNLSHRNFLILSQNYPNPFNYITLIHFKVNSSQSTVDSPIPTTLKIYNILGQKVKTLLDEEKISGNYQVIWDGKDEEGNIVPSGIYFYHLNAGKYSESKKMLFLK
jgi:hypothetical protein